MSTFEQAHAKASIDTLVDEARMRLLWDLARLCVARCPDGAVVEVGVYRGGTAVLLREAAPEAPLVLYDTFTGHPTPSAADAPVHREGLFSDTSLEAVWLRFVGCRTPPLFVVGRFPDSLAMGPLPQLVAFAHVDVDLYESTRDALAAIWPHLGVGCVIVCDDYGFDDCPGAHRAVQEFIACTPAAVLREPSTRQALIFRRWSDRTAASLAAELDDFMLRGSFRENPTCGVGGPHSSASVSGGVSPLGVGTLA